MSRKIRLCKIINGQKWYLADDCETMTNKAYAGLFPVSAWEDWACLGDLEREELPEDEHLRILGAPALPGFEALVR